MAGTCRMKGGTNCCLDNGECLRAPVRRRSTMAGLKIATVERREACVPGNNGTRHLPRCQIATSALPALRSLTCVREGRMTADPRRPNNGADESCPCLPVKIEGTACGKVPKCINNGHVETPKKPAKM